MGANATLNVMSKNKYALMEMKGETWREKQPEKCSQLKEKGI